MKKAGILLSSIDTNKNPLLQTAVLQTSEIGLRAQQHVEEGRKPEPGHVQTLLPHTGELHVKDQELKVGLAALETVQVQVNRLPVD